MQFPKAKTNNLQKTYQVKFGGLDQREGAVDGSILTMTNMSSREYPILATRDARKVYTDNTAGRPDTLTTPNGLTGGDNLAWVDGTTFYYNGVSKGTVANSKKHFAEINSMICIFPDNKYYDTANDVFGDLGATYTSGAGTITFQDGEYANATAYANTIYHATVDFNDYFAVNDALTISGATSDKNESPYLYPIIREISADGHYMRFYEYIFDIANSTTYKEQTLEEYDETFSSLAFYVGAVKPSISAGQFTVAQTTSITLDAAGATAAVGKYFINKATSSGNQTGTKMYKIISAQYADSRLYFTVQVYFAARYVTDAAAITIARTIPTLEHVFENANRLWGIDTSDNSIRCCFLGNPKVWDNFDLLAMGCWQTPVGSSGSFTGGGLCKSNRKPVFHKDLGLYEIFGEKPTNFGCKQVADIGAMAGCGDSIQNVGSMMMYLTRQGFMAYTGGDPVLLSSQLDDNYQSAVAGTSGRKYYVSCSDGINKHLLVYDTLLNVWHREDATTVTHWAYTNDLYYLDDAGDIVSVDPMNALGTAETGIAYLVETNDFTDNSPNKKGLNKVQVRLFVNTGATCLVKVSVNGGAYSTLRTITAGAKQSYFVNFTPKRADYYRLKFEGTGTVLIYSLAIQKFSGSEI